MTPGPAGPPDRSTGPLDRRRPRVFLAVLALVISVPGSFGAAHGPWDGPRWGDGPGRGRWGPGTWESLGAPPDGLGLALLLVAPLALVLLLPRRPVLAVAASVAAVGLFLTLGYAWGPVLVGPVLVLVGVILSGPAARGRWVAWSGAALLGVVVTVAGLLRTAPGVPSPASLVAGGAWVAVLLLVAGSFRDRAGRFAAAREAARRSAEERERTAVTAERLRIARELHDVLAHSLSAITVQAGVGLHLLDRDPGQARTALTHIRDTSRDALDEVREVLGIVRDPAAPLAPTWDLANLERLADQARAHVAVTLDVEPSAYDLPDRLAGVVHRVVQESLTNVRRHAPGATQVAVAVRRRGGTVEVMVSDDGRAPRADTSPGYGLLGMRERVEGSGGTLEAGPREPGPGWGVRAVLPVAAGPTGPGGPGGPTGSTGSTGSTTEGDT
ncbi:sensor histidine kinase [Antribacter gilvus]|uniref:sensor histidine kinase n=1 Tax=Antribacter gilvus TaxID=2304675 RepID=UPI000F765E62|nr:sensor histidine kinase [Antribacter gilvus]